MAARYRFDFFSHLRIAVIETSRGFFAPDSSPFAAAGSRFEAILPGGRVGVSRHL